MRHDRTTLPSLAPPAAERRVPTLARAPRGLLGPLEHAVVDRIDGRANVASIATATSLSVPEITAVIRSLENIGLVRFVDIVELDADELLDDEDERITVPSPEFDRPTHPAI